ncbi:MAG: hypothetical protein ACI857_002739 [Arenicella sp.]|jgi:hypothetical protein
MSKVLFSVFLLLIVLTSKAQDTIIFDDARVHPVKIISVDKSSVKYERRGRTKTARLTDIMQYKQDDIWYAYDEKKEQISSSSKRLFPFKANPLQYPKSFRYSPFSIGITAATDINPGAHFSRAYTPADNWRIRIEPEMHLANWFSIKLPLVIPLTLDRQEVDGQTFIPTASQYISDGIDFSYRLTSNDWEIPEMYANGNYFQIWNGSGAMVSEIVGQIGLTGKFYPFLQPKVAFFIAPSVNFGIANYNQIDYHSTFEFVDSIPNGSTWDPGYSSEWRLLSERLEVKKSYFTFFRFEMTLGFNFNLTKGLNFSLESGISSSLIPLTEIEKNNLYVTVENDGVLYKTSDFSLDKVRLSSNGLFRNTGFMVNRFLLVYRFGGHKADNLE